MLPLWVWVNWGAIAMKGYSAFPKAPALLKPHHQIVECYIQDSRWGSLTPLQRCSQRILQPQSAGQKISWRKQMWQIWSESGIVIRFLLPEFSLVQVPELFLWLLGCFTFALQNLRQSALSSHFNPSKVESSSTGNFFIVSVKKLEI